MILYSIGDAYYNTGKYDSAIVNYQRVLTDYPSSNTVFDALNGMQYCYLAEGKPEKAIQLVNDFVANHPGSTFSDQLLYKKGEIYYNSRNYVEARAAYKDFILAYPGSPLVSEAYFAIGKCSQMLGENQEAVENFTKVFEGYPGKESAADFSN